jgi:hypothetical protein
MAALSGWALLCLLLPLAVFAQQPRSSDRRDAIRVERTGSKYASAVEAKPGAFVTGQDADLTLGTKGFNRSGGPLLLNHPSGLATDGKALLVADRWNNRVLIWKAAPIGNTLPDLVLGQPDFEQNNSGAGRHQLNWPGNVALTRDGQRIAVADTENDRVLIWNSFPMKNGQPADLILNLQQLSPASGPLTPSLSPTGGEGARRAGEGERGRREFEPPPQDERRFTNPEAGSPRPSHGGGTRLGWPWGVWTDGAKLAVVATRGAAVLVWNSFPKRDNQPPDFVLRPEGSGTPRNITSDGKSFFAVSDHNFGERSRPATMVWNSFPKSATQQPDWRWGEWLKGSFTADGKLVAGGIQSVYLWSKAPRDAQTDADVVLRPATYRNGDGPDAVVANGRLYVCTYNGNHILGWNTLPTRDNQPPDFAVGSDRTDQDTWAENYFIQNPAVATDGKSLFVSSDFDRKLFVWRSLPDESSAHPDFVYHLPDGAWDNAASSKTLALAGRSTVFIWRKLPLEGELPDVTLRGRIGSVELRELTGVAVDARHFYLADRQANRIYVWEGIPSADSEPELVLDVPNPGRLNSDGNYLCAAPFEGQEIRVWPVKELGTDNRPFRVGGVGMFNLPGDALAADGKFFVADRSNHRVQVWDRVEDALAGRPADASLGASNEQDRSAGLGRNKLFMPGSVAWGGGALWVGEFKFSTRILRFSPQQSGARPPRAQQPTPSPAAFGRAEARDTSASSTFAASALPESITDWPAFWSQGRAEGKGAVKLTHLPMREKDIRSFTPYGLMVGGHVCPIDHCYFYPKEGVTADVIAPAAGHIVVLSHRTQLAGSTERQRAYDDYAATIEHSGTFYTQYDLLTALDSTVLDALDATTREKMTGRQMMPQTHVRIPVKAGQVIGRVAGRSLDFGVLDFETRLTGFLTPALYGHYSWRTHLVSPFDHLETPLAKTLQKLSTRKAEPRGGRIDYDIDGRLSGNWFREGSGGYAGDRSDPRGYWMGHLAFAYHHIEPSNIVISIGDFGGRPAQHWVKGNKPDPATVSEKDGLVKYELVFGRIGNDGREYPGISPAVQSTVLCQVLPGRKLRFEAFPGQEAREVKGFTSNAKTYER